MSSFSFHLYCGEAECHRFPFSLCCGENNVIVFFSSLLRRSWMSSFSFHSLLRRSWMSSFSFNHNCGEAVCHRFLFLKKCGESECSHSLLQLSLVLSFSLKLLFLQIECLFYEIFISFCYIDETRLDVTLRIIQPTCSIPDTTH